MNRARSSSAAASDGRSDAYLEKQTGPVHDSGPSGLSEVEARARLATAGPNRLPPPEHKTPLAVVLSVAVQPMVLLLT